MDNAKFQYAGLQWIREMELLDNKQLINILKMNVLLVSPRIKEIELLISRDNKQMLVYLELSWLGKKFFKKSIFEETEDVLSQLLPSFKFRVIDDPKLFNMALEKVKQVLTGRTPNAERTSDTNTDVKSVSSSKSNDLATTEPEVTSESSGTDVSSNQEKPSKD